MPKKVFDELDRLNHQSKHQEKASLAIHHINRCNLELATSKIQRHFQNPDEEILNQVLANFNNSEIILVSEDTGMRVLAKQKNIPVYSLTHFLERNSDYLITDELKKMFRLLENDHWNDIVKMLNQDPTLHFNFYLENGNTPLIEMIVKRNVKAVEFLISLPHLNLDLIDKAKLNLSAFSHAAQKKQISIMSLLIKNGANPYITSEGKNRGNSALLIAAWDGRLDIIRWITEHPKIQMSLNQSDNNGFTPLIKAAIKGHQHIVQYLIDCRVDPFIRDRNAMSALDYAIEKNHQEIVTILEKYLGTFNSVII